MHLEKEMPIQHAEDLYSNLVTANDNQDFPVQRWFRMKESFSINLLDTLMEEWRIPLSGIRKMVDPFCGVSTSLLAMQKIAKEKHISGIELLGIERNPFLHFVGQTKLRWNQVNPSDFDRSLRRVRYRMKRKDTAIPRLSTLLRVYDKRRLRSLLRIREAVRSSPTRERDLLMLGYASVLERASIARKDGRALRITRNKTRINVTSTLASAWNRMAQDLQIAKEVFEPLNAKVILGDGRTFMVDEQRSIDFRGFDLSLFSPPYLNNIDYTEVYKLESWMCGFHNTSGEFYDLRFKTFRSHPSVRFPDDFEILADNRMTSVCDLLDFLIRVLPNDRYLLQRRNVFKGYFDDIYRTLRKQKELLSPGGWIFCVIGNSLHGSSNSSYRMIPVASDIISALIARNLGFEVKAVQIARFPKRRTHSRYIRESILVLQS
jgi:hypothetical protein